MANNAAIDKTYGSRSYVTLSCPSCEREVDLYIASSPIVGAWCACQNSAMELVYERTWQGSNRFSIETEGDLL